MSIGSRKEGNQQWPTLVSGRVGEGEVDELAGKVVDYITAKEARQKLNDFWKEEDAAEVLPLLLHTCCSSSFSASYAHCSCYLYCFLPYSSSFCFRASADPLVV